MNWLFEKIPIPRWAVIFVSVHLILNGGLSIATNIVDRLPDAYVQGNRDSSFTVYQSSETSLPTSLFVGPYFSTATQIIRITVRGKDRNKISSIEWK